MATPERLSEHVKVTVAGVLFQPLPEGAGEAAAVIVGGVKSKFTVAQAVADKPEVSTALPQIDWFAPCVLTATGEGQV